MERIACIVDNQKNLADFFSKTRLIIYDRDLQWESTKSIPVQASSDCCVEDLRNEMNAFSKQLLEEHCKILIGKEIVGIPYHILNQNQIDSIEADEVTPQLLELVWTDLLEQKNQTTDRIPPHPIPVDDEGNYTLDFVKASLLYPEISSKKMLIPFLENRLFYSLTIICSHKMPWLEDYVHKHSFELCEIKETNQISLIVLQSVCNESNPDVKKEV